MPNESDCILPRSSWSGHGAGAKPSKSGGLLTSITTLVLLATALVVAGCGNRSPDDSDGAGFVDPAAWRARQDAYLAHAARTLDPGSIESVIANAERARRTGATFDAATISVAALQPSFDKLEQYTDTADFDLVYLLNLWLGYGDLLSDDLRATIAEHVRSFKYWYTDPQPAGTIDRRYYWTENHRALFHTAEYLAGQALPDEVFSSDGNTGVWHRERAAAFLDAWLAEKVRYGFTEWHADGYYQKTFDALITLVEWAEDPDLARRAAMVLDLLLFDVALHLHHGNQGATHGRSYMNSKSRAIDQDGFDLAKLIWDDTSLGYTGKAPDGATLMARARRYRLPAILLRVGRSVETTIDREHMGVALDPAAAIDAAQTGIDGHSFSAPSEVAFWWEKGAHTAWQIMPLTLRTLDETGLWESSFFQALKPFRASAGQDPDAQRRLARQLEPMIAYPALTEVDTYTYRTDDVMLSTAQSYRPGKSGHQHHISQATLDEHAVVFTTHPGSEPERGPGWTGGDRYWTGGGSLPRAAQQGALSISLYAPAFASPGPPLESFRYLDYTHAYFPQERFDEVVQSDRWTFGRRGDGYVALWSWRPVQWRVYDDPEVFTNGLTAPFDLVAPGGADNVFLTQVGDARGFGDFATFRARVLAGAPQVAVRAANARLPGGFDLAYASPTEGEVRFGSTGPLLVNGTEVALSSGLRFDNPWTRVPVGAEQFVIADPAGSLVLDFTAGRRAVTVGDEG